ncbi:MAG TPA: 3-hydroxyacyl-ACP dehydratase FabZ family protein [Phycisphaerae bacterium]|jgi:3-hydroxyacyl-[acyl-carrier-protein] dehydratase|nr:3-hydroxyacyl-ACP dehydratase FabZ family protein [Phycisphaerae bacterium]
MAPTFLVDLSGIDLNKIIIPLEEIRKIIPQRFEMEMLTGIVHDDEGTVVGFKDISLDEFWVRGHIPGRPLMPGVLMIECAAQLCAFWTMRKHPEMGFVGFAKCDEVRFRGTVIPPARLYMIAQMVEINRRRAIAKCQGICNGTLVFEATITGMSV